MFDDLIAESAAYYTRALQLHGPVPRGVDWNSAESQQLRFEQLLRICDADHYSLLDYGCGYGALAARIVNDHRLAAYIGYDPSEEMVHRAHAMAPSPRVAFRSDLSQLNTADFVVASGVFNVKQESPRERWHEYIVAQIRELDRLSTKGFSFNLLTSYSDPERQRSDLYYGDPCFFFNFAKRTFSRDVYLLHDYGLFEFTIGVRKA